MIKSLSDLGEMWKNHSFDKDLNERKYLFDQHPLMDSVISPGLYGTYIMDLTTAEYKFVSSGFKDMLGLDLESILKREGLSYMDTLLHPDDREICALLVNKSWEFSLNIPLSERKSYKYNLEYRLRNSKGQYVRILQQLVILDLDKNGVPISTFGMCTDISYMGSLEQPTLAILGPENEQFIYDSVSNNLKPNHIFTNREHELLKLLAKGLNSKEISEELDISKQTVQKHRRNMLSKADKNNTVELVVYALKCGVL